MKEKWFPVFFALFFGFVCIQRLLETFARRAVIRGDRFMRWSFPIMMVIHSGIFVSSAVEYMVVDRPINYTVSLVAAAFYVFALALRNSAIRTLGRYFSLHIEIRGQHELIKCGVYRYIRHPIYLAVVVELLSVPLVPNAYYTTLAALVLYMPLLAMRLRQEEREMLAKFGEAYRQYQREAGALLPRLVPRRKT
jgi:isoprenylcysteine carboxyl methyltransferase (ICMT) family protein YpbQ